MRRMSGMTKGPVSARWCRLLFFCTAGALLAFPAAPAWTEGPREIVIAAVSSTGAAAQPGAADIARIVRDEIASRRNLPVLQGRRIRVIALDDRCRSDQGGIVAGQAVAVGATLVIGHACNGAAINAARVYARHGIVMIALGVRAGGLTTPRTRPGIFRLGPREDQIGTDIVAFLVERHMAERIAVVHDKSAYARAIGDEIVTALGAQGRTVVTRETYTSADPEYNALVDRVLEKNPDAIVLPAQPIEAGIIAARLRDRGSRAVIVGGEALGAARGFEPRVRRTGTADRRILMLAWPGNAREVSGTGQLARIAVSLWFAAVAETVSAEPAAVIEALHRISVTSTLGLIRFRPSGDAAVRSFIPHVWREGGWRPLDH